MSKKIELDEQGFRVGKNHDAELDLSFLDARLDNAHEDAAFEISPDYFKARRNNEIEDFENLVDSVEG